MIFLMGYKLTLVGDDLLITFNSLNYLTIKDFAGGRAAALGGAVWGGIALGAIPGDPHNPNNLNHPGNLNHDDGEGLTITSGFGNLMNDCRIAFVPPTREGMDILTGSGGCDIFLFASLLDSVANNADTIRPLCKALIRSMSACSGLQAMTVAQHRLQVI